MARITLRSGRVQPVWAGHPWVFAQAVERVDGAPSAGDAVEVRDPKGNFLGRGFWSPESAIVVRIVTRDENEALDDAALIRRIERAAEHRKRFGWPAAGNDGFRLIHAEGDSLPGLIADVYGDVAVVQLGTPGMKRRADVIYGAIARATKARTVVEVPSGGKGRPAETEAAPQIVRGPDRDQLSFHERSIHYTIPVGSSQKTGYYFDQRDNRARVEDVAEGRRVLDLYCYVGSFAMAAVRGGAAEVIGYDSSAKVIATAATIAHKNGLSQGLQLARGDVRRVLPKLKQAGERFDLAIVDPPKFAPTVRHLNKAKSAYRRLNARVFELISEGGLVLTCSCSAALRPEPFVRILALAARDVGRHVTLLHLGQQGIDHPVPAAFPEGRYLKAALLEVR